MNHEIFRAAWLEAIRAEGLLSGFDRTEDLIDLGTMTRKHSVRIGLGATQRAEPFFTSMRLGWEWSPVQSARTYTSEEDLLSELVGRKQARGIVTEPPWLRVDIEMHATLPHGSPLRMEGPEALSRWCRSAPRAVGRTLPTRVERNSRGLEAVHAYLGEPEAHVRWNDASAPLLLGVQLDAWRAIELARAAEVDSPFEADATLQLKQLAADASAAFAAWTASLPMLLPRC